jgi:hypothetical protein
MVDDKSQGIGHQGIGHQGIGHSAGSSGPAADSGSSEGGRRPRTPPTIELEASRVEAVDAAHPDSSPNIEDASHATEARPDDQPQAAPLRARKVSLVSVIVSAVAGAVAAVLVGMAAWFSGGLGGSNSMNVSTIATIETLAARVARLEAAPAPPPTFKPDPALHARLDMIEKSLAALRDGLAAVRAQGERTAKIVDKAVEDIKSTPREGGGVAPDLSAVETRIAQLDARTQALSAATTQVKDAQAKAAEIKPVPADDIGLKRVVAATSLDLAVRQGEPFAAALSAAQQLAGDAAVLKPLESFAASGVPSAATLSHDLLALLPLLETRPDAAPGGAVNSMGWLDRLQASAARLVKFRRNGVVAGDDTAAVMSRAAAAARRNDLAEAKREVMTLPQPDRVKIQPWLDKTDARDAALAASRQFAATAMTSLSKPAP